VKSKYTSKPLSGFQTFLLCCLLFVDFAGFSLIFPLLPQYVDRLSLTPKWMAVIIISFPLFQLLSSPIWVWLGNRVGRRPILLLSTFGGCCAYILLATALSQALSQQNSLLLLCLSRALIGLFAGNLSVAILSVMDPTPPSQHLDRIPALEVALGLGLLIGPAIGGFAFHYGGTVAPAWVMAIIQGLLFLFLFFFLPEILPKSYSSLVEESLPRSFHKFHSQGIRWGLSFLFFFIISCFLIFEISFSLMVGSYRFEPWEIQRPYSIAYQIANQSTPAGAVFHSLLPPSILQKFQHADRFRREELQKILADFFNQCLRDPQFPLLPYWKQQKLPQSIQARLDRLKPESHQLDYRLNRLLIETAFSKSLEPRKFLYSEKQIAYFFAYCGLLTVLAQLFLIIWSRATGDIPSPLWGFRLMGIGLVLIVLAEHLREWLAILALITAGGALARTALMRLLLRCTIAPHPSSSYLPEKAALWGCIIGSFSAVYLQNSTLYIPYLIPGVLALLFSLLFIPFVQRID